MRGFKLRFDLAFAVLVIVGAALSLPSVASAVGAPGTTYSLQIGRGAADASIVKIDASGTASLLPAISGPGVQPLNNPVGITVDAEGYLIVTDSDGYETTPRCGYFDGPVFVNPGCGAILRINPDNGSTQVLATGDKHVNPYSVLLPPDGSITNGGDDSLIISDSAEGLIRLSPGGAEAYFPGPTQDLSYSRGNWDLARDPVSGDIFATNYGPQFGIPGANCGAGTGFVARYDPNGNFKQAVCDPRFTAPRGIVVDATGTVLFVDAITFGGGNDYGALFELTPGGQVNYKSVGGFFSTPSGLALGYDGSSLRLADETGAGGAVLSIAGFGGDQALVAALGSYPIDVAVDLRGAATADLDPMVTEQIKVPKKPKKKKKKPKKPKKKTILLEYERATVFDASPDSEVARDGNNNTTGLTKLVLEGAKPGWSVYFECIESPCASPTGKSSDTATGKGEASFSFGGAGLSGKFRIYSYSASTTKVRRIGYVKDFSSNPGGPSLIINQLDGAQNCLVEPFPVDPKKTGGFKRNCSGVEAVKAKDAKALRKVLTRKVLRGGCSKKNGKRPKGCKGGKK